ncbi:MAG: nucleoside phosphorylase [Lachnospiraceae bacterium]|nr:nucleoside phosphorylase [Lachnospiraceae bacterium]
MNMNDVLTDPQKLVRLELKNAGFDIDQIKVPKRVYLLADSLYDTMVSRNCGTYKYPLGGKLFVFNTNEEIGFIKGHMCSPAIATQAEDLIAGGVQELIHVGVAGGLQPDMKAGDIVLTDGAYNDTAVARLYGFDYDVIESTKKLTDELSELLSKNEVEFRRGKHWTTDAGYRETWGQVIEYREKGALCVEMEGVGLFTIANYRKCAASAIYVISDVYVESSWDLGWGENKLDAAIDRIIDMIVAG